MSNLLFGGITEFGTQLRCASLIRLIAISHILRWKRNPISFSAHLPANDLIVF